MSDLDDYLAASKCLGTHNPKELLRITYELEGEVVKLKPKPFKKIPDEYPKPHQKYLVRRDGVYFTATPCYGMHDPWWVVRIMGAKREADPEPMQNGDEWRFDELPLAGRKE